MNERIKALLLNARNMFDNGVTESNNKIYIHGSEENLEKFAELLIRECAGLAKSKSEHIQSMLTDDRGDRRQIDSLAWQFEEFGYEIKKHFGVEYENESKAP